VRFPWPRSGPPRVVAATAVIAVATGAAGWLVGAQVKSPADAAAEHRAPPASRITAPVEQRTLTATVTTQGTVSYGAPQPVTLTGAVSAGAGDPAAPALITKAPTANRTLQEGDVLMEVSGRPVYVLVGKVPMYRTLTRSSAGDDVVQVRAALRRLMPKSGVAAKGALDAKALKAVEGWYTKSGYQAAGPGVAQRAQLRELERAVDAAKGSGTGAGGAAKAGGKPADKPVGDGGRALADARSDLAEFQKTYGTSIASGEIIFLPRLPVRLTTVSVKAGAPASGAVGTVADPTLIINGDVANEDAGLIKVGMTATMEHATGAKFAATLSKLGADAAPAPSANNGPPGADAASADKPKGDDAPAAPSVVGTPIQLKPQDPGKLAPFAEQSLKITIKVGDTGHDVLAVPVAALSTASNGQARLTVQDAAGAVHDVPVDAGLTTEGYVQVTPNPADALHAGDRVVVGVQ
jgi:hypothetical protein